MRWFLYIVSLLVATACPAEVIGGHVVGVADGDTITILDASKVRHKVRMAGIDAPEKSQAFGKRSHDSLAELVAGKTVKVETHKKDRYGRHVGKVLLNGYDVNLEQVRTGMAWFYTEYAHEQTAADQQLYDQAETEARESRRGLWADRNPQAPWEFRRISRQK